MSPLLEEVAVLPQQKAHLGPCSCAVSGIRGYLEHGVIFSQIVQCLVMFLLSNALK